MTRGENLPFQVHCGSYIAASQKSTFKTKVRPSGPLAQQLMYLFYVVLLQNACHLSAPLTSPNVIIMSDYFSRAIK